MDSTLLYDDHGRVVHVHDPARTLFDMLDPISAAGGSCSDYARALSSFKVSKILHNRVVLPAADVGKSAQPGMSLICATATETIGR